MDKGPFYHQLIKKAAQEVIPLSATFELTHSCNLSCIHCYVIKDKTRKELSTQKVLSILDQLADAGCLFLNFTGGEILTRDDFFPIASHARAKNFALRFLTNGTLITPHVACKIADLSPLSVEISIYGTRPEIHDQITGVVGSFKKTIGAIKHLRKRNVPVVFKTILMKQNIQEHNQIIEMAKRLQAKIVVDPTLTPKRDGSKDVLSLRIKNRELEQLFSDIDWGKSLNEVKPNNQSKDICAAARRTCTISPYGDVYPCVGLPISSGNLRVETFDQIWRDSSFLAKIRAMKVSDLEECGTCPKLSYCRPCMGLGLLEENKLTKKSFFMCQVAEAKQKVATRKTKDL